MKDYREEPLLVVLYAILLERIDFISHILNLYEVGAKIVLSQIDGQVLHVTLFGSAVDDQLGLHDLKFHHEKD